ncbi:MAG: hypothetical protein ABII18_13430 [bacterium]
MAKNTMTAFILKQILILCLAITFSACDNNEDGGGGGGGGTTVTAAAAEAVGPVEQLVTTDVLNYVNDIRGNIQDYIETLGGVDDSGVNVLVKSKNIINDDVEQTMTIDIDESEACDTSGTKNIIGAPTFTLNGDQTTGSVVGTLILQYNDCEDIIVLQTSGGNCSVSPVVDGQITITLNIEYILTGDVFGDTAIDDLTGVTAATGAELDVLLDGADADQLYSFTYSLNSNSSNTNLSGLVTYSGSAYDVDDIESYVSDTATTTICD